MTRAGQGNVEAGHDVAPGSSSAVPTLADDTAAVNHFLENAIFIKHYDNPMML